MSDLCWAVVDTNSLLHYRRLDELDLPKILGVPTVGVVVCAAVIRELDKHKGRGRTARIRKRAAGLVRFFAKLSEQGSATEMRENVSATLVAFDPSVDLASLNLRRDLEDDWVLAAARAQADKGEGDVVVITADLGLKLKAEALGLRVCALPEEAKLEEELDKRERELADLQREVAQLKLTQPALKFRFVSGEGVTDVEVKRLAPLAEDAARTAVMQKRKELRPFGAVGEPFNLADFTSLGTTAEQRAQYDSDVEQYLQLYELYVRDSYEFERQKALWVEIRFALENSGRSPAKDIDVVMEWPGDLTIYTADQHPEGPAMPPAPRRPAFGVQLPSFPAPTLPRPLGGVGIPDPVPDETMEVTRGERTRLVIHIRELKHKYYFRTSTVTLAFPSTEEVRSFGIPFMVYAGNVPEPIKGSLHVKASVDT
jgi:rRNA-processing protein FCF1